MAFYLIGDIFINGEKVSVHQVTWKTSVTSFVDTCTILLSRKENTDGNTGEFRYKEGDKVVVNLGYNKTYKKRFEGFVRFVEMGIPVTLECEGFAYLLYPIMVNRTYREVTLKKLLQDLVKGTPITLSEEIPLVPLKNVRFKNATGLQVLEWLKNECKLAVYFHFSTLYAGTLFGKVTERVPVRIGYNVIRDDNLKKNRVDKIVRIVMEERNDNGYVKYVRSDQRKYSDEKRVRIKRGIPSRFLQEIANRMQTQENYRGYKGDVTLFLEPYADKGGVLELDGGRFKDKSGDYFIEGVQEVLVGAEEDKWLNWDT